jgi:hypothetical protein
MKKLTEMTKKELYAVAQEKGIKNRSKMDKGQLLEALSAVLSPVKPNQLTILKQFIQAKKVHKSARKALVSLDLQFFASKPQEEEIGYTVLGYYLHKDATEINAQNVMIAIDEGYKRLTCFCPYEGHSEMDREYFAECTPITKAQYLEASKIFYTFPEYLIESNVVEKNSIREAKFNMVSPLRDNGWKLLEVRYLTAHPDDKYLMVTLCQNMTTDEYIVNLWNNDSKGFYEGYYTFEKSFAVEKYNTKK